MFVFLLVVGVVTAVWPDLHEMLGLTEWQIAAGCLGLIVISRLIMAPYWAYREAADLIPGSGAVRPDMRVDEALDYIVNDSAAILKQPDPPRLMEYGPAKGRLLVQRGIPIQLAQVH